MCSHQQPEEWYISHEISTNISVRENRLVVLPGAKGHNMYSTGTGKYTESPLTGGKTTIYTYIL